MPPKRTSALIVLCFVISTSIFGQENPKLVSDSTSSSVERRLNKLEAEQAETLKSLQLYTEILKSQSEGNRNFSSIFAALITLVIGLQTIATAIQFRREGKRLSSDLSGAGKVEQILGVVERTLEARLTAEDQARKQAQEEIKKREEIETRYSSIEQFFHKYQETIAKSRAGIEDLARECAKYARHEIKDKLRAISSLAEKYDSFEAEYKAIESEPHSEFSARVLYVRGIAAHYANDLVMARACLEKVIEGQLPSPQQDDKPSYEKRMVIANYFLGIIHSNFGRYESAAQAFQSIIESDPRYRDFLTRVVAADSYALSGSAQDLSRADDLLSEMTKKLMVKEQAEKGLPQSERRQKSRAALIRANIAMQTLNKDWQQYVCDLLETAHVEDPRYYYVTVTLAQAYNALGQVAQAANLFREAGDVMRDSGDLVNVTEARSRVLLLMTAGLSYMYQGYDEARAKEFLDEASARLNELPTDEGKRCLVFSVLTKRNVPEDILRLHISYIRQGRVFGAPN